MALYWTTCQQNFDSQIEFTTNARFLVGEISGFLVVGIGFTAFFNSVSVFLLGSETVERYLQKYDWPRNEPLNGNFPGEVAHEYQALWQQNCPLYRNDVAAAVGGWNMPWPDGDFENLISSELLIWTFEEAEPWIEVFRSGATHRVFQRIT